MKKIFYVIAVALLIIGCTENKSSKMIPGVMTVQTHNNSERANKNISLAL